MSQFSQTLLSQFRAMSRMMQIGVVALLGILLFLVLDSTLWEYARTLNGRADSVERVIADSRQHLKEVTQQTRELVAVYGPVDLPSKEAAGSERLNQAVVDIVKGHGSKITNFSYKAIDGSKLGREALQGLSTARPGERYDRLRADVKFDCTTEIAAAVLAQLESHPDIEAISSLRIVRHDQAPRVSVTLQVEAWVIAPPVERRGGAAAVAGAGAI